MRRECRNAKEFGEIFRASIRSRSTGWRWKRDIRPWLADALMGVKFGDPSFGWTVMDAEALGQEFVSEASTW
jgi:hypothetical protein